MEGEFARALTTLQRHISPFNARTLLLRALNENGLSPERLTRGELRRCHAALRRGITLFVNPDQQRAAFNDVEELCGGDAHWPEPCTIHIVVESDIARVRAEARRICTAAGASAFTMQKVATIGSELARNAVLYANGGIMDMVPVNGGRKHVVVRSMDRGPGIPHLEEVLSGRYRSKTGMGRGILGTKRLADRFDISSGPGGTLVVAEVFL